MPDRVKRKILVEVPSSEVKVLLLGVVRYRNVLLFSLKPIPCEGFAVSKLRLGC